MRADVIKVNILTHQSLQVPTTENENMIQTLAPDTADEALANGSGVPPKNSIDR